MTEVKSVTTWKTTVTILDPFTIRWIRIKPGDLGVGFSPQKVDGHVQREEPQIRDLSAGNEPCLFGRLQQG